MIEEMTDLGLDEAYIYYKDKVQRLIDEGKMWARSPENSMLFDIVVEKVRRRYHALSNRPHFN